MTPAEQRLIQAFTEWYVFAFLLLLGATVAVRMLTGSINTDRLLWGRTRDGTPFFSPGRAQLLIFTLGAAAYYLRCVIGSPAGGLPDVPPQALAMLAGSHGMYLGGKAVSAFGRRGGPGRRE